MGSLRRLLRVLVTLRSFNPTQISGSLWQTESTRTLRKPSYPKRLQRPYPKPFYDPSITFSFGQLIQQDLLQNPYLPVAIFYLRTQQPYHLFMQFYRLLRVGFSQVLSMFKRIFYDLSVCRREQVNLGSQWHLLVVFSFFIVNRRIRDWQQKFLFAEEISRLRRSFHRLMAASM